VRSRLWLLAVLLLSAAGAEPARADITANYYVWGPIGPEMKVQVSDRGDARVEMGGHLTAIRRGGIMYLVRKDDRGTFVMTADEFERIEARLAAADPLPPELAGAGDVRVVEAGTEVVGGRRGTVLLVHDETEPVGAPQSTEMAFVVSDDADLRPLGPVIARMFGGGAAMPMPPAVRSMLDQVHSRGTLVRMWSLLRLTGTSREPIPPRAFALPGPVLNGDEAYARLSRAW
jgi:hypothetical protein